MTLGLVVAAAPAVTFAQAPTDGLTVSASPRWGRSTPGTWTPYAVTVSNQGGPGVEGHVALVPVPAPASPPAGSEEAPSPSVPEPEDPTVIALSRTEFTVAAAARRPLSPAEFPTYRTPVALAGGSSLKSLTFSVVEAPYGYRAELRGPSGKPLASSPPPPPRPDSADPANTVALLSQTSGAADALRGLEDIFGPERGVLSLISSARDFPKTALLLSGLHVLVVDRFDTASLDAAQIQAIGNFVAFGGSLVLAGGADGRRQAEALPDALVPMRPTGTVLASMAPLADLVGRTTDVNVAVLTGELRSGRPVLQAPGGVPLVVRSDYGAGRVVQLAYDPLDEPLAFDSFLRDLSWRHGLLQALDRFGAEGGVSTVAVPPEQLWSSALGRPRARAWPTASLWLLVGYALLCAPLGYALLRRRRRTELLWVAMVPIALVVGLVAGFSWWSQPSPGGPSVEVHTLGPEGEVLRTSYRGVTAEGGSAGTRQPPAGALTSTVFVEPVLAASPGGRESVVAGGSGGGGAIDLAADGQRAALRTGSTDVGTLQTVAVGRQASLQSQLELTGSGPPEEGGLRVKGTIANRSSAPVTQLRVQLPEGALARLTQTIGPGQVLAVDDPFVWPSRIPAGSGMRAAAAEQVMFAAAGDSFSRGGQAVVAGVLPSPTGTTTVVVQPVPLDRSQRLVARSAAPNLVASYLEPAGGTVSVHDLGGLPGPAALQLEYGPFSSAAEVYDWTTATWRLASPGGGGKGPGTASVRESEIGEGTVRIRTRGDPRHLGYQLAHPQPERR